MSFVGCAIIKCNIITPKLVVYNNDKIYCLWNCNLDRAQQEHGVSCENSKIAGIFLPHMSDRVDAGRVRRLAPPDLSDMCLFYYIFLWSGAMWGGRVFGFVNEVIFIKHLSKATLIRGLELPVQPRISREGEGREIEFNHYCTCSFSHAYVIKHP